MSTEEFNHLMGIILGMKVSLLTFIEGDSVLDRYIAQNYPVDMTGEQLETVNKALDEINQLVQKIH